VIRATDGPKQIALTAEGVRFVNGSADPVQRLRAAELNDLIAAD
jgi:hypothetical protein